MSTWPDISHLSASRPELINVLRQIGQQDYVSLKNEVNELLRKGHLREFLSEKATSHLSKETTGKPTEAAPISPPRQDRVIHVIWGGSEISGISHAAAKRSPCNSKHGLEAAKPKCLLLGTDKISFTVKEQEKVLTPHHDALVILLTVASCLNSQADALANLGSSLKTNNQMSIPLLVLLWPDTMEEPPSEEAPGTSWRKVIENLDHSGFEIPNKESFSFFMRLYKTACKDPFPLDAVCGSVWKNVEGQISFRGLQAPLILANPHKSGTTTVARPQRIKTGMRHKAGMGMRKPEYAVKSN
ncbi:hypothetical protein F2Q69_00023176 [Brassica cretica]|uniref:Uncharacterized protein n=1 Tax=Brassica cretica TaxID=69181 RepID=A0A8S9QJB8_BRACR|nr:hypothetical protein F2Q69_00023176 [Brassica cretica]